MSERKPILELETISSMPEWHRQSVPSEDVRLTRRVGDSVRLLVLINGLVHRAIWVRIVRVNRPVYVGVFEAHVDYLPIIANGTEFEFTADHIIDY